MLMNNDDTFSHRIEAKRNDIGHTEDKVNKSKILI